MRAPRSQSGTGSIGTAGAEGACGDEQRGRPVDPRAGRSRRGGQAREPIGSYGDTVRPAGSRSGRTTASTAASLRLIPAGGAMATLAPPEGQSCRACWRSLEALPHSRSTRASVYDSARKADPIDGPDGQREDTQRRARSRTAGWETVSRIHGGYSESIGRSTFSSAVRFCSRNGPTSTFRSSRTHYR